MSTLKIRLEVAANLLSEQIMFPDHRRETERVAKILKHYVSGGRNSGNQASSVLEKEGKKPFLGLGGFIQILISEIGDLTKPSQRTKISEWFQTMLETGFPQEAVVPCVWAPDELLEESA